MKPNQCILIVLLILISNSIIGQNCTYTFTGLVEDFHDKSPIVDATIHIKNLNRYAATDLDGKFSFKNLCAGKLIVEVSHVACDTQIIEINLTKNTHKVIDLEHHIEELNEVQVKSSIGVKTKTSQETLIKENIIEEYSDASLGDALKEVSGVSTLNTGNSIVKPIINGLHSSRILISINNVRLQDQDWGVEHAPNVDISAAGSISVIKGANALEYGGDAIGGVVVINPPKIILKDSLYGKTIISQQTNGRLASINTSINKSYQKGWFINGQASLKRAGDFEAPNYNLTNTSLKSFGINLSGGFKKFDKGFEIFVSHVSNEIGILRAAHIGSTTDLVNSINSGTPSVIRDFSYDINNPKQDVTHLLLKANFYKRFKGLGKFRLQYDFQQNERKEFDVRRGGRSSLAALDLNLKTHNVRADMKFDANPNKIFKIGISGGYQTNFPDPGTGVRRLIPDYDKYILGVYTLSELIFFNGLIFSSGIRYDFSHINAKKFYLKSRWNSLNYDQDFSAIILDDRGTQFLTDPTFNYHNLSASVGLSYEFDPKNSLLFNYGLSNRAPNPAELFSDGLHHTAARIELGDLRIRPESSHRISSTYKYSGEKFKASVEGFYNFIDDFIYIEPSGTETTIRGAFVVWSYKQIKANLFGLDSDISYQINDNFSIRNRSSYIKGKDLSSNRALIDIPPFKTVNTIQYSNNKWNDFYANLESDFNARQNDFPNNNFTTFVATTNTNELVDISTPPNAYHLLNFSTGFNFKLSKTKVGINLFVNNILNTTYRDYLNQLRFFADDIGRNFKIQLKLNY
ncbi:TonB-dependent receptor [Tenacibaculum jejuense]|uniref:Probable TonB-dependent outer membrane receptor n=1 Tax=Tenacibaculum jejuense TaxID=584609 RepID=A0A238UAU2_9FLAO|nr:TonB-dependent receptor [Tenacibaculum jejuense]SNR16106.1 Probable TonB-dependent outer membrane receptor precursor [Tenacibaculum jejuense]